VSNLLTPEQVFLNQAGIEISKERALGQLVAPHARRHGLQVIGILSRIKAVELRDGFVITHAAMERSPRIAMTFGVYPSGVTWADSGRPINLVAMVLFARDTYDTWRAYRQKMAMLFWQNDTFQRQLIQSTSRETFLSRLRREENAMI
jgi:mannitol/fructose-specific phosphotransferase system IIA component (Ntr-type)